MTKKHFFYLLVLLFLSVPASGMHIAEGFLPVKWALIWAVLYVPFLVAGFQKIKKNTSEHTRSKLLFAVTGAFVFILSSLKIPSVAGSSSHLTGIALGAILFGASSMSVVGLIVLIFQALLLAHGGLTTLGANAFSMSVVGAFSAVWIYQLLTKIKSPGWLAIFLAAFFSDLLIYVCTSFQLAAAFQSATSSLSENLVKFLGIFAVTQLPLAVIEGVFTVFAFRLIMKYNRSDIALINSNI